MYTKYFGFNEKPFTLTPNPRFIYLSKNHKESFAHLLYGINNHYGFIELIGEVGTGKTTVLRTLLGQLGDDHYRSALIFNPCLSGVELLRSINHEFGLSSISEFANELLIDLNRFLLDENAKGTTVVLVIDEAQNLRPEVLEQLRLISNLETENDKLIQIILAGQPELEVLLARPELRQLNQRIAVRYRLKSMSMNETRAYIRRRMEVAGETGGVSFSMYAIRWIYLYTHGVPRMINILCDRALLVAYGDERRRITSGIVTRAIKEILDVPQRRNLQLVFSAVAATILIAVVSVTFARWMPSNTGAESKPLAVHSTLDTKDSSHKTVVQPSSSTRLNDLSQAAASQHSVPSLEKELPALDQNNIHLQALNAILSRWNVAMIKDFNGQLTIPYKAATFVNKRNLNLTEVSGTLHEVLRANIPFIIETRVDGSRGKYCLAITAVTGDSATVTPSLAGRSSIPLNDLEKLASGTYYLIWNNHHKIPEHISAGSVKYEIRALQQLLKLSGAYNGPIDGIYGTASLEAVRMFQKKNSIPVDSSVGAQTVAYLYRFDKSDKSPNLKIY